MNPVKSLILRKGSVFHRLRRLLRGAQPVLLVECVTQDGLAVGVDPDGYIDRSVIDTGYFERPILDAVIRNLPDDGTFWDIGGNFGLHSLTVKHLRPSSRVFVFEPVPFMAARIAQNRRRNRLDLQVLPIALGDHSGYETMSIKIEGNSGLSSFSPWANVVYDDKIVCRMERGDCLVDEGVAASPSVIKIDVEGFELQVLLGLPQVLASPALKAIVFESDGKQIEEISRLLGRDRFAVAPLAPASANHVQNMSMNYLALRS